MVASRSVRFLGVCVSAAPCMGAVCLPQHLLSGDVITRQVLTFPRPLSNLGLNKEVLIAFKLHRVSLS